MKEHFKGTCILSIVIILLLVNIGCSQYNGDEPSSAQSNLASDACNPSILDTEQEPNDKNETSEFEQLFQYNGLTMKLTNIKEIKQGIATDGLETWEYDIYVVYPGATMFIPNENVVNESSVALDYSNLGFFTSNCERISISSDMAPVEITNDIQGIVDGDANAWVIAFELYSED